MNLEEKARMRVKASILTDFIPHDPDFTPLERAVLDFPIVKHKRPTVRKQLDVAITRLAEFHQKLVPLLTQEQIDAAIACRMSPEAYAIEFLYN